MHGAKSFAMTYVALGIAGAVIASVLTSFHISIGAEEKLCSAAAGCGTVNASPYSTIGAVPIALLGLGAYVVVVVVALLSLRSRRVWEWSAIAIFSISLIGTLYSAYLTYLELFVIRAVCPWCVASALIMTAIWGVSILEFRQRQRRGVVAPA
jgi:uncharacterized membrane protein